MVCLIAKELSVLHKTGFGLNPISASANVFEVMTRWLSLASGYSKKIKPSSDEFQMPTIAFLREEICFTQNACLSTLQCHPRIVASPLCQKLFAIVLCHNDMLSGNLMFNKTDETLRLIDFEYSGFNYAAADLANLLCAVSESILIAGKPQNVKVNFPSETVQLHLLSCYFGGIPESEKDPLLAVLAGFVLADELRWTIWNIIQENQSTIPFDYCRCYNSRFSAYLDYKEMFALRMNRLANE